jgi:three-Cys-motif partner protein
MAYVDLHDKPFDETTLAKLQIFEDYAQAWVPTFVMSNANTICIFDFFAGTGYDKNGIAGSPIRILKVIKQYIGQIFQKKVKVLVFINEYKKTKFELLQKACNDYLEDNKDVKRAIDLKLSNLDFDVCFNELLPFIQKHPSLVFLDQNGIKYLSDKYFLALEKTTGTDFLYFISSSYFWRFGESEEFKMHLDINLEEAKKDPYQFIHRNLIKQLYSKLPHQSRLKLYPFSLMKGTNIHGIIFGAKHIRAVDKFLDIAWKNNPINGEANFDIDKDKKKGQLDIFGGKSLTKIEAFNVAIEEKIKSDKALTNSEIFYFTLEKGHPASQANVFLKELKKEKKIDYPGISPKINYKSISNKERVEIKWLK